MATLPTRTTASFDAIKPVSSLVLLDNEFNQYVGGAGFLNGNSTATKLLVKSSDAADPPIEIDQIGAGPLAEWKQNGTLKTSIANSGQIVSAVATGTAPLSIASTTAVTNLNADLLDGRHLAGLLVSFSQGFSIVDPSTATLNVRQFGSLVIPAGGSYTITQLKVMFREGSHTAGASVTFNFDLAGVGDIGTLALDDTNNTISTLYVNNIGDLTPIENNIFSVYISARSGTVTERSVMAIIEGHRTVF